MKRSIVFLLVLCMLLQAPVSALSLTVSSTTPRQETPLLQPKILPAAPPSIPLLVPRTDIAILDENVQRPIARKQLIRGTDFLSPGSVKNDVFTLSLSASKYPGKPADTNLGYPVRILVFVDWNRVDKSWYFQWQQLANISSKVIWQVSSMPYTGSTKDMDKPLGLLANGLLDSSQREFKVDFAKFAPAAGAMKKHAITPEFNAIVKKAVMAKPLPANVRNKRIISNLKVRLQHRPVPAVSSIAKRFKAQLTLPNAIAISELVKSRVRTPSAVPIEKQIISPNTLATQKNLMESLGFRNTQYKYYVRVITLGSDGKPSGKPSNAIEVLYGDPSLAQTIKVEQKPVVVQYQNGEFAGQENFFMDWSTALAYLRKRTFLAPLSDFNGYAYSFFQVTAVKSEPDKLYAFLPDGLIKALYSEQRVTDTFFKEGVSTSIDFNTFVPPPDPANPVQILYYVRAVHVYADYNNPGKAQVSFSPPAVITYGSNNASTVQDAYTVNIDIGTPSIRFTQYAPPFFGDDPWDYVQVTKDLPEFLNALNTIPNIFHFMKAGEVYRMSDLQNWLLERQEQANANKNDLEKFIEALGSFFSAAYDIMSGMLDFASAAWADIQASVIKAMAAIGIPESIGGYILSAALVAAGIPPTLPNFDDLKNLGAEQLALKLVEQSGGYIPEVLAKELTKELFKQAEKAANATINNLPPGDLAALNGYIKPDNSRIWRPATITLEVSNPLPYQIPSGEFDLELVEANKMNTTPFFRFQRVSYPPLKAGQTTALTLPLEENCEWRIDRGEKLFADVYTGYTELTSLLKDHKQIAAVATNVTPHIPAPAELEKELGLSLGTYLVHMNYQNTMPYIRQNMNDFNSPWIDNGSNFSSTIYVSPQGNDSWNGSKLTPLKTPQKAVDMAKEGTSILLMPGTYSVTNLNLKPYGRLMGTGPGVILKATNNAHSVLVISSGTSGRIIKDITLDGGLNQGLQIQNAGKVWLEGVRVINSQGTGMRVLNTQMDIKNCEVAWTSPNNPNDGDGIKLEGSSSATITGCNIHDIRLNGIAAWDTSYVDVRSTTINKCGKNGILSACPTRVSGCNILNVIANGVNITHESNQYSQIENTTISQCGKSGVLLEGKNGSVINCFIHDTDWAGVALAGSENCSVTRCTILNTGKKKWAPITFAPSPNGPNKMPLVPTGPQELIRPVNYYAKDNIIAQLTSFKLYMIWVLYDGNNAGLALPKDTPWVRDNIYYFKSGTAEFLDERPSGQSDVYDDSLYNGGLAGWIKHTDPEAAYYGFTSTDTSKELNPNLDAQGRSTLPQCQGKGVK
jgi:parallel beta-helix repeat protein